MSLSKRTRFEIFKRDCFTCQYCGRRPPEVVLEVDHIEPKSKGGSDDQINLITSCADCNRGKSDKRLGEVHPRPDADMKFLEAQQELAEAKRFLDCQKEMDEMRGKLAERLLCVWEEQLTTYYAPTQKQWSFWLTQYSPEEIDYAIRRTYGKYQSGGLNGGSHREVCANCVRYVSGILKSEAQQRESNG